MKMTLQDLFNKYEDLSNPKISGVEFYQFFDNPAYEYTKVDLITLTSLDNKLGDTDWSGLNFQESKANVGNYLLNFPYEARILIFKSVEEIDLHLMKHGKQFNLPGYTYSDDIKA